MIPVYDEQDNVAELCRSLLEVLDANPLLTNLAGPGSFSKRADARPATRFAARGRKLGHEVWDLAYVRKRATTESRYR